MSIDKLIVGNFKGVADLTEFEIKPITLFIGPNSSGKSSCIHALAALAQTVKLGSTNRAIVLDDEYAQVHLGRFIEVIHSKKYSDSISIGLGLSKSGKRITYAKKNILEDKGPCEVLYSFKSTKRTQDVYIDEVHFDFSTSNGKEALAYKYSSQADKYSIKQNGKPLSATANNISNLRFRAVPGKAEEDVREEFFETFILSEGLNEVFDQAIRKVRATAPNFLNFQ